MASRTWHWALFNNYAEIGERAFTKWRALATDIFVQDSWKPSSNLTVEGGVRWAIWPPWYSQTNNIASFDPRFYDPTKAPIVNPATGRLVGGDRYNGISLPGDGFEGDGNDLLVAQDPRVQALFRGEPRGFSDTHYNAFEPRLGMSYAINEKTIARLNAGVFHNRVTLNDSSLLGGNPPFQPMVSVASGNVDNPGGAGGGSDLPLAMQGQEISFKHPTAYTWSAGVQREIPYGIVVDATYVGRRGLYLQRERNINQLQPGTVQANPGVNVAALRPYKGYSALRIAENSARSLYNSLQLSADKRYSNGFKFGMAYTLGKSEDNASGLRNVLWNTYDDTNFWGPSSYDRTHVLSIYYIYDLPFWRDPTSLMKNLLGGWQISGSSFFRTGHPVLNHADQRYRGCRRRRQRATGGSRRRYLRQRERQVLGRGGRTTTTSSSTPRPSPTRRRARSGTRRATSCGPRATSSGTWRFSRTSLSAGSRRFSCEWRCSTSSTTRT